VAGRILESLSVRAATIGIPSHGRHAIAKRNFYIHYRSTDIANCED